MKLNIKALIRQINIKKLLLPNLDVYKRQMLYYITYADFSKALTCTFFILALGALLTVKTQSRSFVLMQIIGFFFSYTASSPNKKTIFVWAVLLCLNPKSLQILFEMFGGIFMRWSLKALPLLIRNGEYLSAIIF